MRELEISAGQLNSRVTIGTPNTTQNELGEVEPGFTAIATDVPAEVKPLSGKELAQAQQIEAQTTHQVTMRFRPGIKASMQLGLGGGRWLNILSVIDVLERHVKLIVLCVEV